MAPSFYICINSSASGYPMVVKKCQKSRKKVLTSCNTGDIIIELAARAAGTTQIKFQFKQLF